MTKCNNPKCDGYFWCGDDYCPNRPATSEDEALFESDDLPLVMCVVCKKEIDEQTAWVCEECDGCHCPNCSGVHHERIGESSTPEDEWSVCKNCAPEGTCNLCGRELKEDDYNTMCFECFQENQNNV